MEHDRIQAANQFLDESSPTLSRYFTGLEELEFLLDYDELYRDTRTAVQTWDTADNFSATEIKKGRNARRLFSQCVIVSSTVVEYLSSVLLFQQFKPRDNPETLSKLIEDENQHSREQLLSDIGILQGALKDRVNRIRGTRNDFAHNVRRPLDLQRWDHPLNYLSAVWEVISFLTEEVYGKPLDTIAEQVRQGFTNGRSTEIDDWTTAQIVDRYVMITQDLFRSKQRGEWNQDEISEHQENLLFEAGALEQVLEDRGFDPNEALEMGRPQRFQLEKNVTQCQGIGGPLHVVDTSIPEETIQFQPTEFQATFAIGDRVKERVGWFDSDTIKWYSILFVDDLVVAVYPTDVDGIVSPKTATINDELEVSFEYTFNDWSDHTVSIGTQVETDDGVLVTRTDPKSVHVESDSFIDVGELEY